MIISQPVRKINPAVVRQRVPQKFETVKNFGPKVAQKKLYFAVGSVPPPPPGGSGDGVNDKNLKRPFTTEELAKIHKVCQENLLLKNYFANMLYSKSNKGIRG